MLSSKILKLASTNYRLRQLLGGLFGLNIVGLLLENWYLSWPRLSGCRNVTKPA